MMQAHAQAVRAVGLIDTEMETELSQPWHRIGEVRRHYTKEYLEMHPEHTGSNAVEMPTYETALRKQKERDRAQEKWLADWRAGRIDDEGNRIGGNEQSSGSSSTWETNSEETAAMANMIGPRRRLKKSTQATPRSPLILRTRLQVTRQLVLHRCRHRLHRGPSHRGPTRQATTTTHIPPTPKLPSPRSPARPVLLSPFSPISRVRHHPLQPASNHKFPSPNQLQRPSFPQRPPNPLPQNPSPRPDVSEPVAHLPPHSNPSRANPPTPRSTTSASQRCVATARSRDRAMRRSCAIA